MKQPTDDAADILIRLHATYRAVMMEAHYLVSLHSRIHTLSSAANQSTEKLLQAFDEVHKLEQAFDEANKLEQEICRPTE